MPRLMEKKDWLQTMADVGSANDVWFENVVGDACTVSLSLPEAGRYREIFVKLDGVPPVQSSSSSHSSRKISPKVRALRGAARLNDSREYKEILADALAERHVTREKDGFANSPVKVLAPAEFLNAFGEER